MEILINKKWFKVSKFDALQKLQFTNLQTAEKLILEEWFYKIHTSSARSKDYKINSILIDDSKFFSLKGILISSVGDSSLSFHLHYDSQEVINVDIVSSLSLESNLGVILEK